MTKYALEYTMSDYNFSEYVEINITVRFGWSQDTKQRLIELMYSSSGTIIYYHIIGERGGHNLGNKVQDINNTLNSVRGGLHYLFQFRSVLKKTTIISPFQSSNPHLNSLKIGVRILGFQPY